MAELLFQHTLLVKVVDRIASQLIGPNDGSPTHKLTAQTRHN